MDKKIDKLIDNTQFNADEILDCVTAVLIKVKVEKRINNDIIHKITSLVSSDLAKRTYDKNTSKK